MHRAGPWTRPWSNNLKHNLIRIIILLIQIICTIGFIFILSICIYIFIYQSYVPKPLKKEKLYFNYAEEQPTAFINLLSDEKQWINHMSSSWNGHKGLDKDVSDKPWLTKRFLQSSRKYDVYITAQVARSMRNYDLGKVVLSVDMIDGTNNVLAESYRPIILPYQPSLQHYLEAVTSFPGKVIGLVPWYEYTTVTVNLIEGYSEPPQTHPPTARLEFQLSTSKIDLLDVELSIIPQVSGLIYYMTRYPYSSAAVGITILSIIQGSVVLTFVAVSIFIII
jgi:hypothetical protein